MSLEGSYSYTDGEYDEADAIGATGRQLAYLAPHKAALGMRAAWGRVSQLVRVRYVSERFGDARNTASQVMGDYCALDWRLRVHLGGHVDLTVNVDNLLDESYEEFPGVEQPGTVVMTGIEARW